MSSRAAARLLCAAAFAGLWLSGAVHDLIPACCLAWLGVDWLLLGRLRWRLPALLLPLACASLFLLWVWFAIFGPAGQDRLPLLLAFAAPGLVLCTFPPQTPYKTFLIVLISLVVVVGSAGASGNLVPALIVALYLLSACHALPRLVRREPSRPADTVVRLLDPPRRWSAAASFAAHHLALAGLLIGSLLYLAVPRLTAAGADDDLSDADVLAAARRRRAGADGRVVRTGFPREITIGQIGRIKRRDQIVFVGWLRVRGRPYDPRPEEGSMLLLRANAWDTYDPARARWTRRAERGRELDEQGMIEDGAAPVDWNLSIRGYDGLSLFLPQRARRIRTSARPLRIDSLGIVRSEQPVHSYGVEAGKPATGRNDIAGLRPETGDPRLLQVPLGLDTALKGCLREIASARVPLPESGSILAAVESIRAYFEQGKFRYTLDLPAEIARADDPLIAFLRQRRGHCELYASAACMFLRMMGIPARVAGGVRCAERLGPGRYRARYRNAHAWVEIPCRRAGYVAFDFTPADERAEPVAAGTDADRPDAEATAEDETRRAEGGVLDWGDPFRYGKIEQQWLLRRIGRGIGSFAVPVLGVGFVLALVWALVVAWRRREVAIRALKVGAPTGTARRTLAFYARWLRACARQGYRRRPTQTPREFLATLPLELQGEGRGLTAHFEARRYGPLG